MKKKHFERMLVYVILVIICMISLFPFIWTTFAATHSNTQFFDLSYTFRPGGALHSNYEDLLASFPLWRNMANSLLIALIYTAGAVLIDTMAGYAFAKLQFKGKNLIFACCLIGMFIPAQMTMIPLFIEISNLKLIDTIWAVILPGLTSVFGVFLMRQNMQSFPTELIESARIDGCSEWRIFWRIVLPNMWPSVTSLSILSFVNQWGNFMWPLIALNSKEHYTMPLVISLMVQPGMFTNYGAVMVGAVLTTLPVLIFFLIFQKKFINGMLSGALKG